ncbi:L,D-transpeptidase family protein [Maritimibacter sp. DP1N21-5]|uniref:L,D-transpeptidase family protein n=1 Tax=Maritimibacter sp. DP1N21-5 TaxID=2836867 RepID=UPI001C445674|nr:L,D-transpeptidase family protein [Maritimibacter sp. DP1N21-5]
MNRRMMMASMAAFAGLSACSSKFKTYNGPEVTEIFVFKENRKMYLMHHREALKEFDFDLGFAPYGHKQQYGDGRTPEGTYYIDRRNPDSAYHLSIGVSYPNPTDSAIAKECGVRAGGDIFIHGGPTLASDKGKKDWTAGCIAVRNKEIEDIYAMVRNGTPVHIVPAAQPIAPLRPGAPKPLEEVNPEVLIAYGRLPDPALAPVALTDALPVETIVTKGGPVAPASVYGNFYPLH